MSQLQILWLLFIDWCIDLCYMILMYTIISYLYQHLYLNIYIYLYVRFTMKSLTMSIWISSMRDQEYSNGIHNHQIHNVNAAQVKVHYYYKARFAKIICTEVQYVHKVTVKYFENLNSNIKLLKVGLWHLGIK